MAGHKLAPSGKGRVVLSLQREEDLAGRRRRRHYGKLTDMGGSRKQRLQSERESGEPLSLTACTVMRNNRAAAIAAAKESKESECADFAGEEDKKAGRRRRRRRR